MFLDNASIKKKVYVFPVMLVLSLFIISILFFNNINSYKDTVFHSLKTSEKERVMTEMFSELSSIHVDVFSILSFAANDVIDEEKIYELSVNSIDRMHKLEDQISELSKGKTFDGKEFRDFRELQGHFLKYRDVTLSAITMATVELESAKVSMHESNASFIYINKYYKIILEVVRKDRVNIQNKLLAESEKIIWAFLTTIVFVISIFLLISMITAKKLIDPIMNLVGLTQDVKIDGTYSRRAQIKGNDELGLLTKDFNGMLDRVQETYSKQEELQEELRNSLIFNKNVVNSLSEMLFVTDNFGKIIMVNIFIIDKLNYKNEEEIKGQNIFNVLNFSNEKNPEEISNIEALKDRLERKQVSEYFGYCRNQVGSQIPLLISAANLKNSSGEVKGFILSAQDASESLLLSEIKENQQSLIESAKFASLGEMSANIAHEINNPLAIINGLNKKIRRFVNENTRGKSEIIDYLDRSDLSIDRVSKIIKGLKTFSRGDENDELTEESIKNIVENTLAFCQERFLHGNVNLYLEMSDELNDLKIKCLSTQISQVLINLLNNAYDSVCESDKSWVKVVVHEDDRYVKISVVDSGNGISNELEFKIFEPFFSTKDVGKGTGLGLSLSRQIINHHDGDLVINHDNSNTEFVIILPKLVAIAA